MKRLLLAVCLCLLPTTARAAEISQRGVTDPLTLDTLGSKGPTLTFKANIDWDLNKDGSADMHARILFGIPTIASEPDGSRGGIQVFDGGAEGLVRLFTLNSLIELSTTGQIIISPLNEIRFQTGGAGIQFEGGPLVHFGLAAPAVSAAGRSRTYFDSSSNTLRISENAGAYMDVTTTKALATTTAGSPVVVSGAAPPTSGQVLTATSATAADWQTPSVGAHALGGAQHTADTLANLNSKVSDATLIDTGDSRLSDERTADAIATTGADVNVDLAAPPSTGQVLTATGATTSTWQTPAITDSPRNSAVIDIANIAGRSCLDTSLTVTGAATGSECALGLPTAPTADIAFSCFVSAADTVQIRACNHTNGGINPASATYSARVFNP